MFLSPQNILTGIPRITLTECLGRPVAQADYHMKPGRGGLSARGPAYLDPYTRLC